MIDYLLWIDNNYSKKSACKIYFTNIFQLTFFKFYFLNWRQIEMKTNLEDATRDSLYTDHSLDHELTIQISLEENRWSLRDKLQGIPKWKYNLIKIILRYNNTSDTNIKGSIFISIFPYSFYQCYDHFVSYFFVFTFLWKQRNYHIFDSFIYSPFILFKNKKIITKRLQK